MQTSKIEQRIEVNLTELAPSGRIEVIHVLHVDDDPLLLEISELMLKDLGNFEIDNVLCVDEAFKKLAGRQYDVVVSDYEMPQKDGLEFLRLLKDLKNETPFILFTGKGREDVAIKALNLGAKGYFNKQGSPETVYGELAHGIITSVEHVKAAKAVVQTEAKFRELVNSLPEIVFETDLTGKITFFNQQTFETTGFSREEIEGRNMLEFVAEKDKARAIENTKKSLSGENIGYNEYTLLRKNKTTYPTLVRSVPIISEGKVIGLRGLIIDITDRKKVELERQEKFEALEKVAESIGAGLAVISRDYNVFWANKTLTALGVSPNKKCYQTLNLLKGVCPDCGVKKVFEQNVPLHVHEYKTVDADGKTVWIELRVTPLKDKNGNITAALELAIPITDRKLLETKFQESMKRLNKSQEIANVGSWELDLATNSLVWSDEVYRIFGFKPYEFGASYSAFLEAVHPDDRAAVNAAYLNSIRDGADYYEVEHRIVCKASGEVRFVFEKCEHIRDSMGKIVKSVGMVQDITERKKIENALVRHYNMFSTVMSNIPDAIYIKDINCCYVQINRAYADRIGLKKPNEAEGKTVFELHSPDEAKKIATEDLEIIKTKEPKIDLLKQVKLPNGNLIWTSTAKFPLKSESGEVIGIVGISRDITELKKAEQKLKLAVEELKRSNSELEQFAYVASHDLQEPLRMVTSYMQLVERRYKSKLDSDGKEFIGYAVDGANRMRLLINDLLTYSRVGRVVKPFEHVNLKAVFDLVVSNLQLQIQETNSVVVGDQLPIVWGDKDQLVSLFQNLINNSIKFHGKEPPNVKVKAELKENEYWFSVQDNGIGIDPQYFSRLFKIFQRLHTKDEFPGSGIGLVVCRKIVELHKGRIWLESSPGKGTNVYFTLPYCEGGQKNEVKE